MVDVAGRLGLAADLIPDDHSRQTTAEAFTAEVLGGDLGALTILDLGCGDGRSIDFFRQMANGAHCNWVGVDIEDSDEVKSRVRDDGEFLSFDGVNIPLPDASVDIVYSKHVFEHVRFPAELLKEIHRVLRPHGHFLGSTSQLECYHSRSYWNYTIFGFNSLLNDAGLKLLRVRPSIDGFTLVGRRVLPFRRLLDRYWTHESPFNRLLELMGRLKRRSTMEINTEKLLAAGQFCFWARPAGD